MTRNVTFCIEVYFKDCQKF